MTRRTRSLGTRTPRTRADAARGSITIELAIVAPALLLLLSLVVVAARISAAGGAVEQAAAAAARAASLMRDPRSAEVAAQRVVDRSLADQGVTCTKSSAQIDTSGFSAALGQPAEVAVQVTCQVPLADLAMPGLPGSRVVRAWATSPLDSYRTRP